MAMEAAEVLKPFYERASEAEKRLSRLEVALGSKKDVGNEELLNTIHELQSKLAAANAELDSERVKAEKLAMENAKHQYRVIHLVRAIREDEAKFKNMTGGSEGTAHTISKLEDLRL